MRYILIKTDEEKDILIAVPNLYYNSLRDGIDEILDHQEEYEEYSDIYNEIVDLVEECGGGIVLPDCVIKW